MKKSSQLSNSTERYLNLQVKEIISRPYFYASACKELSFILRSYSKFPKNLQTQIFQDTLFAFSLLPEVHGYSAIPAAKSLLHSAEFALPKQKRAVAVKEYKHAAVAYKRNSKLHEDREEEDMATLPEDVLVNIFGFLDLQSLVSVAEVCRSWKAAANDKHLWKILHATYFSNPLCCTKNIESNIIGTIRSKEDEHFARVTRTESDIDWRNSFKRAYIENCLKKFKSKRGYCLNCSSIIWLRSNKCCTSESCKIRNNKHRIKILSMQQIVEYIIDGFLGSASSSDSDSSDGDSDEASSFKLWAYGRPLQING